MESRRVFRLLVICVLVLVGIAMVSGVVGRVLPGDAVEIRREELYSDLKDFEINSEGALQALSYDPWITVNVQRERYVYLTLDVAEIRRAGIPDKEMLSTFCQVFYCLSDESSFSEGQSVAVTLKPGRNDVRLPHADIDTLRLDLTDMAGVCISLGGASITPEGSMFAGKSLIAVLTAVVCLTGLAFPLSKLIAAIYLPVRDKAIYLVREKPKAVLALMTAITLFICFGDYLTGRKYFAFLDIGSDTVYAYQPFFLSFADDVRRSRVSEWTLNYGLGTSTLEQLSWCLDPFVWPAILAYLLSGMHLTQIIISWAQVLKYFLCAMICYDFLKEFKIGNSAKILSAYAYAFCGFLMLWGQHYRFATCFFFTSLLFLFLERSLRERKITKQFFGLLVSVGWLSAISYYFAYMSLVAAAVYTLVRLFSLYSVRDVRSWFPTGSRVLGAVMLGMAVSGFIFIPRAYEIMTVSDRISQSGSMLQYLRFCSTNRALTILFRFFSNNLQGVSGYQRADDYYGAEQLFYSSFQLLFFAIYVYLGKYEGRRTVWKRFFLIAALVVLPFFLMTGVIFNGFVGIQDRYTYVFMPVYAVVCAKAIDGVFKKKVPVIPMMVCTILYFFVAAVVYTSEGVSIRIFAAIFIEFVVLAAGMLLLCRSVGSGTVLKMLISVVLIINICSESWLTNNPRSSLSDHYSFEDLKEETDSIKSVTKYLSERDKELYRIEKTYSDYTWFNDAMIEDYYGVSYYNSVENSGVRRFFSSCWRDVMFRNDTTYIQFELDPANSEMAALMGVKYIVSEVKLPEHPSYQYVDEVAERYVYQNLNYKGFGQFYNGVVSSDEFLCYEEDRRSAILQNHLVLDYHRNPQKTESAVSFDFPQKEDRLNGTAVTDSDGYVFLPIPYEGGWKAEVNHKSVDILKADYGFMAIPVEKGINEILLIYDIPYLKQGATVTAFSLIIVGGLAGFMRKGRKKHDLV